MQVMPFMLQHHNLCAFIISIFTWCRALGNLGSAFGSHLTWHGHLFWEGPIHQPSLTTFYHIVATFCGDGQGMKNVSKERCLSCVWIYIYFWMKSYQMEIENLSEWFTWIMDFLVNRTILLFFNAIVEHFHNEKVQHPL